MPQFRDPGLPPHSHRPHRCGPCFLESTHLPNPPPHSGSPICLPTLAVSPLLVLGAHQKSQHHAFSRAGNRGSEQVLPCALAPSLGSRGAHHSGGMFTYIRLSEWQPGSSEPWGHRAGHPQAYLAMPTGTEAATRAGVASLVQAGRQASVQSKCLACMRPADFY